MTETTLLGLGGPVVFRLRRFRAADARAICASGLARIGQFRRPGLRVAIATLAV